MPKNKKNSSNQDAHSQELTESIIKDFNNNESEIRDLIKVDKLEAEKRWCQIKDLINNFEPKRVSDENNQTENRWNQINHVGDNIEASKISEGFVEKVDFLDDIKPNKAEKQRVSTLAEKRCKPNEMFENKNQARDCEIIDITERIVKELKPHVSNQDMLQNIPQWRRAAFVSENNYEKKCKTQPAFSEKKSKGLNKQDKKISQREVTLNKQNIAAEIKHILPEMQKYLVENELFKMEFDFPSPRPHFIIVFKNKPFKKGTLANLSDIDIQSILNLIDQFINVYGLQSENLILSFHTGCWVCFN